MSNNKKAHKVSNSTKRPTSLLATLHKTATKQQRAEIKHVLHDSAPFTGTLPEEWKCQKCGQYSTRIEYHKCIKN